MQVTKDSTREITMITGLRTPELAGVFEAMPADGLTHIDRARYFSQFERVSGSFNRLPHEPYRKTPGAEPRRYAALPAYVDQHPAFTQMLEAYSDAHRINHEDVIDVHAIRVVATKGAHGLPTTQFHRDNTEGVSVFVVSRPGLEGGVTSLRVAAHQVDVRRMQIHPGEALIWRDLDYVHFTSPVRGEGARDVFVVTHRRPRYSFNALYRMHLKQTPRAHGYHSKKDARALADKAGVRAPRLYAVGKVRHMQPPTAPAVVLKPNAGVESAGVLPLLLQDDGRYLNPWSGETKHWSQWVAKSAGIHPYGSHDWLIEEMIGDGRKPPYDWKFHCIGGRAMLVSQFRRNGVTRWAKVWSRDFKPLGDVLPNRRMWLKRQRDESMPPPMDGPALIAAAERLAKAVGGMFCRVDLYEDQRGPVFGEITMRPSNVTFAPSLDRELGKEWIAALQRSGAASSS